MTEIELLQQLIRIPSQSGQESQAQAWIERQLLKLDMKPVRISGNTALKIPGIDSQRALIFNAHIDTVSPGSSENWKYSPFSGQVAGSRIYGRGASDNKASAAVLLKLASNFAKEQPVVDLWLTWTNNEETTGQGMADFVANFKKQQKKYQEAAAIVMEPTANNEAFRQHKGNIFYKAICAGDSGHGSRPDLIKTEAIEEMLKLKKSIKKEFGGNMTMISAGETASPNKFPESCQAIFDIRTTIQSHQKAVQRLAKLNSGEFLFPPVAPGYTKPTEKIVKIIEKLIGNKAGEFYGSADLCWLTQAGIPGVIFGPGEPNQMHKPNEYCEIKNLAKCTQILMELINNFGVE